MFKLLFSTAMIAPVLLFAATSGSGEGDLFATTQSATTQSATTATPATEVLFASAELPAGFGTCESDTVAVVFQGDVLEAHSAERIADAFGDRPGCDLGFVRLTTLVPENPDAFDRRDADRRRAELAATIQSVVGEDAARTLPVHSDVQTAAAAHPIRHHAIVSVERRATSPATPSADTPAVTSVASALPASTLN